MMLREEDAGAFKKWVLPKLETISDADAGVLADYVVALVTANQAEAKMRLNCVESLADFLRDNTASFVDELVQALKTQSYVPRAPPKGSKTGTAATRAPDASHGLPDRPTGPPPALPTALGAAPPPSSRKRKLVQRDTSETRKGPDAHYNRADAAHRPIKQATLRAGQGLRGAAAAFEPQHAAPAFAPPPNLFNMANLPPPPPGPFPFDLSNPMAFFSLMAALGPNMPAMPPLPLPLPPFNAPNNGPTGRPRQGKCYDYHENGYCSRGTFCLFQHAIPDGSGSTVPEYDPDQPSLGTGFASAVSKQRASSQSHNQNQKGRRPRAQFSLPAPSRDLNNTTLVVEQIPEEQFSDEAVRSFFSKFGTITEIQMHAYKRLAIVEFEDRAGADQAYHSPKVVFDNRFVKVYWYDQSSGIRETLDRKNEEALDLEAIAARQAEAQKAFEERRRKFEEAEAKSADLDRQLAEKDAEMNKIKQLLAELTGNENNGRHEGLSQDLATLQAEAESLFVQTDHTGPPDGRRGDTPRGGFRGRGPPRGRGTTRGAYRGRGNFVPPFAGNIPTVKRLDNRPRRLSIAGIEKGTLKDEALRQYLVNIPECISIEPHPEETNTLILTFKERFEAEMFLDASRSIPDVSPLELAWIPNDAFGGIKASTTTAPTKDTVDSDTESLLDERHDLNNTTERVVEDDVPQAQPDADMDVAEDVDEWL
ncbi:hypothetical protein BDU57DRAFT_550601 [Ampelomyces quisqualis]|uniref:Uncharacterized protein n=1 Tax=Ampelomyces quisqualis TaxID=50730 RepID=A0A6A5QBR5_AMPQU|nr:hypothetical protein BDU57DRAFT_550601 [Ampelomyces quisqualis]